jgi:Mycothiol maleylpyruvate isomerase N-terminal domain
VTDLKKQRIDAEDQGWTELRSLVTPLTPEQTTRDGYFDDWSVKDLMAHLGCWMAEAATMLERMRMGTFDGWDDDVEGRNRQWQETWRDVDLRIVWAELHSARARMLEEWDRLAEITDDADEWFRESAEEHYAEHLPRLRAWVEEMAG